MPESFSAANKRQNRRHRDRKLRKHRGRTAPAAHNKTPSPLPLPLPLPSPPLSPSRFNHLQSLSHWTCTIPTTALDEETDDAGKSNSTTQQNGTPKTQNKTSQLSAVTEEIPCHIEKSGYSSHPAPPINMYFYWDEEINHRRYTKEADQPEQSQSALLQVILVSRILKGIPQTPHFLPLKSYSEVAKHSLINAWDRIFEQVVDKLQSMQVKGYWVNAKRMWKTIEELQKMGYNVIMIRRRLVEFTDAMLELRRHRSEISELKTKAEEQRMGKCRLEFEIVKLQAKVEGSKAEYEDALVKVGAMDEKIPRFKYVFSEIPTKKIEVL